MKMTEKELAKLDHHEAITLYSNFESKINKNKDILHYEKFPIELCFVGNFCKLKENQKYVLVKHFRTRHDIEGKIQKVTSVYQINKDIYYCC